MLKKIKRFFGPRYMMMQRDEAPNTALLFRTAQEEFFFGCPNNKFCFITPYVIMMDGTDVCCFVDNHNNLQVGQSFPVRKPTWFYRRNPAGFDKIIGPAITKNFFNEYDSNLTKEDYSLICTSRAIYSLDNKLLCPIYFMILPNDRPVKLARKDGTVVVPVSMKECFEEGGAIKSANYLTKIVGHLVAAQDISLPIFSYKSSLHEDL